MKPICQKCGVRAKRISCEVVAWKCPLCMTKQEYACSCELCTLTEKIVEKEFIDDVIEFKPYFKLGE